MPFAQALEAASVKLLLNKLVTQEVLDFFLKWSLDKSLLAKLKTMLLVIYAVLNHAEERQFEDEQVKEWLEEVKDASYDAEDILDEIVTDALELQLNSTNQVGNFIYDSFGASDSTKEAIDFKLKDVAAILNPFVERVDSKMKSVLERLEDLAKQKDILRLREDVKTNSSTICERPPTTPLVNISHVYGRESDKKEIIKLLTSCEEDDGEDIRVVPIVGMGGVGKTTLAQLVFNDENVRSQFGLKAWACVSDEFDVMRITKSLVESATKKPCNLNNLELLQERLKRALNGRKFLLVLDDVWNESYGNWDNLRLPLTVGAPGSSIIVTTRSNNVAAIMGSASTYHLKGLSDDDCLSLLKQIVFPGRTSEAHADLVMMGEEMAKKCKGLPLAAMVLGGLLRTKRDADHWKDILHSRIWGKLNSKIVPVVRLSYHYLPAYLKRCFAYCSMFPKDYKFDMETLTLLWMAEGFVLQPEERNRRIEDEACNYFHELVSRSFFQREGSNISQFKMHDLIHDLAKMISGKMCIRLEDTVEVVERFNENEKARHLSYVRGDNDIFLKFKPYSKTKCLRTFLPLDPLVGMSSYHLSAKVSQDFLPKLRSLRVLSLSGYFIRNLPDSMENMKLLRFLDLSCSYIEELPESISSLYNLQTLILFACRNLKRLPTKMGSLVYLRHLNNDRTSLQQMPPHMGKLKYLQTLSNFVVAKEGGSGIGELKHLDHLRGKFSILGIQNVASVKDAIEARLEEKQHLDDLTMEWTRNSDGVGSESSEAEVIDALQPHENLEKLTIRYYGGTEFPSWMGNPFFTKMVYLHLYGCVKCKSLPSLGELPLLKDLIIEGMDMIEHVGLEFIGSNYSCFDPFPSLETLKFENMKEWKQWSLFTDGEVKGFAHLREISIFRCPKLMQFWHPFPSLEKLRVKYCQELTTFSKHFSPGNFEVEEFPRLRVLILVGCTKLSELPCSLPSLKVLEIEGCEQLASLPRLVKLQELNLLDSNIELLGCLVDLSSLTSLYINQISTVTCLPKGFLELSTKLEELKVVSAGDLKFLSNENAGLSNLASLRSLTVSYCPNLVALASEADKLPPSLEYLDWRHCHNLQKLPHELSFLKYLTELRIEDCPKLELFPDLGLPPMLKRLVVQRCNALKTLPEKTFFNNISLEYFEIGYCSSLVSLLEQGDLPATLKHLFIFWCKSLKLLPDGMMTKNVSLEYLEIENCCSFESFPEGQLPSTLKRFEIQNCINLKSLPAGIFGLMHVDQMTVTGCSLLEYFTTGGRCNSILRAVKIAECEKLKALPVQIHNLNCLQELEISCCPSLASMPKQGLPISLKSLRVTDCVQLNPIHQWKLHKLTSLKMLTIGGLPGLVAFSNEYLLPYSITDLTIKQLPELESISEALQSLNKLETLSIYDCGKLHSLPEKGLPATLSELIIRYCPLLSIRCEKDRGEDWPKIADIPFVEVD